MVLGQTLQTRSIGKGLGDQEPNSDGQYLDLGGTPAMNVLQECRERRLLEGFLKIFVSDSAR